MLADVLVALLHHEEVLARAPVPRGQQHLVSLLGLAVGVVFGLSGGIVTLMELLHRAREYTAVVNAQHRQQPGHRHDLDCAGAHHAESVEDLLV